jgi:hypothetical protein
MPLTTGTAGSIAKDVLYAGAETHGSFAKSGASHGEIGRNPHACTGRSTPGPAEGVNRTVPELTVTGAFVQKR